MGSSKKHKKEKERDKETRKRKHRSRSRSLTLSDSPERDRERKHRRHKERRREKSSDVEEVPVDSHLEKVVEKRHSVERDTGSRVVRPAQESSTVDIGGGDVLSVEETNKLRAKLGLKPLQVEANTQASDGKIVDDLGEFYHKPAENLNQIKHREKLKERITVRKEKRLAESKFSKIRALGESDSEEDNASAWINRNREITKQKEEAAKRAAILDELDAEFGLGALAAEEEVRTRNEAYSVRDLRGLKVAHDTEQLPEGRSMIMTLEDKGVLDDGEDTLVNVNLKDQERYDKSNLNKKKISGYNPYEGADDPELYGAEVEKNVLEKYDEEIGGEKKRKGFVIGDEDRLEMEHFKKMMIKEKLSSKRLESLVLPEPKIASVFYTEEELKAKFKKPKKRGKMRKKVKIENPSDEAEMVSRGALVTDDTEVKSEVLSSLKMDEDDDEQDNELEQALARARTITLSRREHTILKLEELVQPIKKEEDEDETEESPVGGIVLDSTAEFCRTLGDIPTYGQAGNRDVGVDEMMELGDDDDVKLIGGAWSSVDPDTEAPLVDATRDGGGALEAEPRLDAGVGGALKLAFSKGYLERGREARPAPPALPNLRAAHYSIDDKAHNDDDKLNRRERGHSGPVTDFKEKDGFKPHVKLDYVDDEGRPLKPKEAFRYLSHKFHGKGPGKNKQEKRIKQTVQEGLMKKMNSTDTPLGTLALLQARQKEARTAFLVLSGTKKSTPL